MPGAARSSFTSSSPSLSSWLFRHRWKILLGCQAFVTAGLVKQRRAAVDAAWEEKQKEEEEKQVKKE